MWITAEQSEKHLLFKAVSLGKYGQSSPGKYGDLGSRGNLKSATCRAKNRKVVSNPPLSAIHFKDLQAAQSKENPVASHAEGRTGAFTALHFNSLILTRQW